MLEDEVLKLKFRRGSREALARIYEKYLDSMLSLAVGLLNNTAEAQDVVHDVFVSFAKSAEEFRVRGSLSGYLATSVVNRVRDRRRQRRRQASGNVRLCVPTESADPDEKVIVTEQAARLAQAIAELPEDQREVILLRLKAGMRFREIARLQQVSINTALGRYRYGLNRLRATLNGEVEQ